MTLTPIRQTLITLLSDGQFHSGEQLGEQLGISRAAVSKHMAALKELGLDLFSLTGKGYRLAVPMALYDQATLQGQPTLCHNAQTAAKPHITPSPSVSHPSLPAH